MSMNIIIIAVTCLISFLAFQNHQLRSNWMFNAYAAKNGGQWYRFITSGFIHKDWMHLGLNMFMLWMFGDTVEYYFGAIFGAMGKFYYLGFYILGIIVSEIPSYLKNQNNPGYNSLGASGAVSAAVFASIMFNPLNRLCLYGLLCFPGFVWAIVYLIYSYYQGKKDSSPINHDAHLAGAVFGIVFMIVVHPPIVSLFMEQMAGFSFSDIRLLP